MFSRQVASCGLPSLDNFDTADPCLRAVKPLNTGSNHDHDLTLTELF